MAPRTLTQAQLLQQQAKSEQNQDQEPLLAVARETFPPDLETGAIKDAKIVKDKKALILATAAKMEANFRVTVLVTAGVALWPFYFAWLRDKGVPVCLGVSSATCMALRSLAYIAVLLLDEHLTYSVGEIDAEMLIWEHFDGAEHALLEDWELLVEQVKWTRTRQVLFSVTTSSWYVGAIALALAATIYNWEAAGGLSGLVLTLCTGFAVAVTLLPPCALQDTGSPKAWVRFGTLLLVVLMALASVYAWRQGGDVGLAVHLIGVMAGLTMLLVRLVGLVAPDNRERKGELAAMFVGAALIFGLIAAALLDLPELLQQAVLPDVVLEPMPVSPATDPASSRQAGFVWLSRLTLLVVGLVLGGGVLLSLPPLRTSGKGSIPNGALTLLTAGAVICHRTMSLKVFFTSAYALRSESAVVFLVWAGAWLFLQVGVRCVVSPGESCGPSHFGLGCLAFLSWLASDIYHTVKNAALARLLLGSEPLLTGGVPESLVYLILQTGYALYSPQLCRELQASFLPALTRGSESPSKGGRAEASDPSLQGRFRLLVWSELLWAAYRQTREGTFWSVVLADCPQALLGLHWILTDPTKVPPMVLCVNVVLPVVQVAFALLAHCWLAPLVIVQLSEQWVVACRDDQPDAAAEWMEELIFALDQSSDPAAALEAIKVAFTVTPVTELVLRGKHLTTEATKALACLMKESPALQVLDLSRTQVSDEGVKVLAQALKVSPSLQELYLFHNRITDVGASALADALKLSKSIRGLYLGQNRITSEGAKALAAGLQVSQSLQKLFLYENRISDAGMKALAEAALQSPSLQRLYLGGNPIGEEGQRALHRLRESKSDLYMGLFF